MFYRLDVLQAYCLMFPHDFVNLNAVMFPWWLKCSKDFFSIIKRRMEFFFVFEWPWGIINEWFSFSGSSIAMAVSVNSRTDYFMNTWGKSSQIIIYPLSRVKCKVQDENFNNIHDASQSKSCKLHHNILYF